MSDENILAGESQVETSSVEVKDEKEESLQSKYLRWSIPSLVLAAVTAVLWICSVFFTEPSIQETYRQLSRRNLEKLRLDETSFWVTEKAPRGKADELSPSEERRLLDETVLALRRLVILNTRDDWAHYQLGKVAIASAKWYRRSLESNLDIDEKTIDKWRGEIVSQEKRARDEMAVVVGLGGKHAKLAVRWALMDELRDLCFVTDANLGRVETLHDKVNELIAQEDDEDTRVELRSWQAKLNILKALSVAGNLTIDERTQLLDEARTIFDKNPRPTLEAVSWHAESMLIFNPEAAVEKAREAVQLFFTSEDEFTKSPLAISSAFKNLLIVGAMSEAENLIVKAISGPPTAQSLQIRNFASSASFRQMISIDLGAKPTTKNLTLSKLLGMSFRLAPNSEWIELYIKKSKGGTNENGIWGTVAAEHARGDDPALYAVFKAIEASDRSDENELMESLVQLQKLEPGLFVSFSSMVTNLTETGVLTEKQGEKILQMMSERSEDQLGVWYARVAFCSRFQRVAEEIKCLEFLRMKNPENEQVLARLQELQSVTDGQGIEP